MMKILMDRLMGRQRMTLNETQRALVLRKGKFHAILGAGEHVLSSRDVEVEMHNLSTPRFTSAYADALLRTQPGLAAAHLTLVETGMDEVKVVSRNGRAHEVITPDHRALYWTDAGTWSVETLSLAESHALAPALAARLLRSGLTRALTSVEVAEGKVGILSVDGVVTRVLEAGT
ncbi:MAG: hypothetical protein MK098_03130 [Marinovum sp.]|nr:hypothetical protein [Marinovum sp.]